MKRGILISIIFLSLSHLFGQVIYLSTTNNRLYRLNIESCNYTQITSLSRAITDIAFHPDKTLYGVDANGNLFTIDTLNGSTTNIYNFGSPQRFNSLTASAEGILYTTGDQGALFTYDKSIGAAAYLGLIGYRATGDLTFFKGKLYAAAEMDRIILVDINNPPNSSIAVDGNIPGEVYGIVSYSQSCDSIKCYAISSGQSDIYEINFTTKTLNLVCSLNIRVGGGASTYEFFGSTPIIYQNVEHTDPSCSNNDGSFTIHVTGGIAPITYSINGIDFQSSNTFTNLPGGNYQFIVSDFNGCNIIEEVTLINPPGPVIENVAMVPTTCGSANGEIDVSVNGGNGMIGYSIDGINFQSSPVFNTLNAGLYYITVQDASGCRAMDSIELTSLLTDTIKSISASLASCDITTGSLLIDVQNGTGIQYSINGINFQPQNLFEHLSPATYLVTIQDSNGCRDTVSAVISPPIAVTIDNVTSTDPLCNNDEGSIMITATGGTGQIEYSIDGITFQNNNHFDHLAPLIYQVFIHDKNGCADTAAAIINPGFDPVIDNITLDSSHCEMNDGSIIVNSSGGTGQIQYSIDGLNFFSDNTFDLLAPSDYRIIVQDINGCRDTTNASIRAVHALMINDVKTQMPRCDVNDGTLEIITTGAIGAVHYSIDGINFQPSNAFSNLGAGHYSIDIEDDAGCKAMATTDIASPSPILLTGIETQPSACEEITGSLVLHFSGGTGQTTVSLDDGAFETQHSFYQLTGGLHEVIIADENGCQVDTLIKIPRLRCKIYIPNSFSPNQDGINDFFLLSTPDEFNIRIVKYMIFDRWGNLVYSADDFPISSSDFWWDGTFKKMSMSSGVFAYYIEIMYDDGGNEIFKGDVTLVR